MVSLASLSVAEQKKIKIYVHTHLLDKKTRLVRGNSDIVLKNPVVVVNSIQELLDLRIPLDFKVVSKEKVQKLKTKNADVDTPSLSGTASDDHSIELKPENKKFSVKIPALVTTDASKKVLRTKLTFNLKNLWKNVEEQFSDCNDCEDEVQNSDEQTKLVDEQTMSSNSEYPAEAVVQPYLENYDVFADPMVLNDVNTSTPVSNTSKETDEEVNQPLIAANSSVDQANPNNSEDVSVNMEDIHSLSSLLNLEDKIEDALKLIENTKFEAKSPVSEIASSSEDVELEKSCYQSCDNLVCDQLFNTSQNVRIENRSSTTAPESNSNVENKSMHLTEKDFEAVKDIINAAKIWKQLAETKISLRDAVKSLFGDDSTITQLVKIFTKLVDKISDESISQSNITDLQLKDIEKHRICVDLKSSKMDPTPGNNNKSDLYKNELNLNDNDEDLSFKSIIENEVSKTIEWVDASSAGTQLSVQVSPIFGGREGTSMHNHQDSIFNKNLQSHNHYDGATRDSPSSVHLTNSQLKAVAEIISKKIHISVGNQSPISASGSVSSTRSARIEENIKQIKQDLNNMKEALRELFHRGMVDATNIPPQILASDFRDMKNIVEALESRTELTEEEIDRAYRVSTNSFSSNSSRNFQIPPFK